MNAMSAPLLLTPLPLRQRQARNRLVLPPMCMYCVDSGDGVPTDFHVLHYGTRAAGGFGAVIVEATAVAANGRLSPADLGLWEDSQVPAHRRVVDAIHAGGALAGVQLGHGGRKAGTPPWRPAADGTATGRTTTLEGWDLVAPSAEAYPGHATPREMSEEEIRLTIADFASAARRAVEAGYDLVELHGAHGYLIHQFLSPLSNHRTDAYGGSPEGRRRLALEAVAAVREAVGPDTVVGIRLSATDWAEGGLTSADTAELARQLVAQGVDVLHISTSGNVPARFPIGPGYQVRFAAEVKQAVAGMTTPGGGEPVVIAVGLIENGPQAEQVLMTGQADAVAVGRYALRDPYAPLRWAHELGVNEWDKAGFPLPYWRGTWR
ncbi:NADH:flavin oxidoreductase/NADH oxidase [Actinomyces urogenitalis]|uniref:NADH:flavin oxidoreductase/NADH oxidase n=1 Tax=Actinomyces urogenitalis TaxID=103621 RepID=UPI003C6C9005